MGMTGQLETGLQIDGGTDNTAIGNIGDRLKVDAVSSTADGQDRDASGRLRVSNLYSLLEFNHRFNSNPTAIYETTATGGTSTHSPNNASQLMEVTTTSGSSVIRQSRVHYPYHPGKSQLAVLTGHMGEARSNCRKRIGLFQDNDGMFFQQDGSTLSVVIRSATSGSPVDTVITQSNWNLDKLDGSGSSGVTIDVSKQNIFVIDYQWLGSGRVRFGFSLGGETVYCHEVDNANNLDTVYTRTGTLPVRYEITNTGTTSASTTMQMTCGSIMSEGGFEHVGVIRSVNNSTTLKTVSSTVNTPIIAIRLNSVYQVAAIQLLDISIFCQSVDDILWEIYFNPTLTGASWTAAGIADYDVSSTSFTGGLRILSGYIRGAGGSPSVVTTQNEIAKASSYFLGANNFTSTSDILLVSCKSFSTTANMTGAISFREIT